MIGMIPPAKGGTLGRSRRTGPFQGLIDDARQPVRDGRACPRPTWTGSSGPRAPWKRIVVMFAGPFMNLILAVVLFAIVLMGIGVPTAGTTDQRGQRVRRAGLRRQPPTPDARRARPRPRRPRPGSEPATGSSRSTARPFGRATTAGLQEAIRGASGTVDGRRRARTASGSRSRPTLIDNQVQRSTDPNQTVQAELPRRGAGSRVYERQTLGDVFVPRSATSSGAPGEAIVQSAVAGAGRCSVRCSSARSAT